MSTLREAAQQALEALEGFLRFAAIHSDGPDASDKYLAEDYAEEAFLKAAKVLPDLRTALAQPEPRNQCGETCERAKLCAVCARGLAQQALRDLEQAEASGACEYASTAALRAALAQEEREPAAVHQFREANSAVWYDGHADHDDGNGPYEERVLYTHPPRREWRSLSEEERADILFPLTAAGASDMECARAIEQALKEKNCG